MDRAAKGRLLTKNYAKLVFILQIIAYTDGYLYFCNANELFSINKIFHFKTTLPSMSENNSFSVFSGTNTRYLADKICKSLGCELGHMSVTRFADGEFEICFEESVRGKDVFLVQSTFPNADNLMELLLMIDAAKRASARTINAVIPYFGWARQDRKSKPRVSNAAKLVADMLSVAGIDRLVTMDLLQCACRPSVRQQRTYPLHSKSETEEPCHRGTRRGRHKESKFLRQILQLSARALQQDTRESERGGINTDYRRRARRRRGAH